MSTIRLKDRLSAIPHGFKFVIAAVPKWKPAPWLTFDMLVKEVIRLIQGNKAIQNRLGWPSLDYEFVADKVDEYNAKVCQAHGWHQFIKDTAPEPVPIPKVLPRHGSVVARAVAGAEILKDWLGDGGVPVSKDVAEKRASVCLECRLNGKGDWTSYFTLPASHMIRFKLSLRNEMALSTSHDEGLGVCEGCGCPLKLKVFTPLHHILNHASQSDLKSLESNCWVLTESQRRESQS